MSDNHQTIEDDAGNMISSIMQTMEQAAESSNFDDELSKIMETFELIQERLLNSCLMICEALGCVSGDDDDDGLVDEELDLSDVPEAER